MSIYGYILISKTLALNKYFLTSSIKRGSLKKPLLTRLFNLKFQNILSSNRVWQIMHLCILSSLGYKYNHFAFQLLF